MYDRDQIIQNLKEMLGEKRLRHSLCVETRAAELAGRHGCDAEKAAMAGLLHDICHDMPKDEQLKYLQSHGILLDIFTQGHPML
ncbi:MAG: HD domain-containing protein, partial [Oscillospiraceae bacterium]|nr:HD domain-containing protein [Oscillospiraceae bacterium]